MKFWLFVEGRGINKGNPKISLMIEGQLKEEKPKVFFPLIQKSNTAKMKFLQCWMDIRLSKNYRFLESHFNIFYTFTLTELMNGEEERLPHSLNTVPSLQVNSL
jgi:hypothetical protein